MTFRGYVFAICKPDICRVLCHSKDIKKGDNRVTCENIVARLISDPDKYQFGKNKLFFRAGQVAYMEKLRSDKLKACGIMIQKNVKMWLYRKKYLTMLRSARVIQRWTRGHLARQKCREIRRNLTAVKLNPEMEETMPLPCLGSLGSLLFWLRKKPKKCRCCLSVGLSVCLSVSPHYALQLY